jgi:NAD+ synthase (glutamine-hydrolysing)
MKTNIFRTIHTKSFLIILIILTILIAVNASEAGKKKEPVMVRVAAGSFLLEPNLDANVKKINKMMNEAGKKKVDLLVFPECALTGYPPYDKKTLDFVNQQQTAKALKDLQKKARKLGIAVAIGAAWKDEKGIWLNRAFLIDENGEILGHYDKIQLTGHDRQFFVDGKKLPTFQWRGIKVGMLICLDHRYPELWRLMRKKDVSLMLHLVAAYGESEWKVPVLEGTMRGHAASNGYHIISCNNSGPIPELISAIYNPWGLIVAKANYAKEELIVADIDASILDGYVGYAEDVYELREVTGK